MERTWKKTLAAGFAAVALVAALLVLGGRLPDSGAAPDDRTTPQTAQQQEPDSRPQEQEDAPAGHADNKDAANPYDSAVVGPAQTHTDGDAGPAEGGQDRYQTDPVPEGRPAPVEPDDVTVEPDSSLTCTISISCATILDNMEQCAENKRALVPADGVILPETAVAFRQGESVYDVLQRACRDNGIHMEASFTPMYNSAYIEGIHNLYEFDVGAGSGWMYHVNGWFPNYGCSRYQVQDGDTICFVYTCDLGADVGDNSMTG